MIGQSIHELRLGMFTFPKHYTLLRKLLTDERDGDEEDNN
jgi:hypothetical protein